MLARSPIYHPARILMAAGGRIALRLLLITAALLSTSLLVATTTLTSPDLTGRARLDLLSLRYAVVEYHLLQGHAPPDLLSLVDAHILPHPPRDPWQQPFTYHRSWKTVREVRISLCTAGPDRIPDTEDDLCLDGLLRSPHELPTWDPPPSAPATLPPQN
jgi:hypothetical protein